MKQINFSFLLTVLLCLVGAGALAYDAKIDGIYYNFSGTEATVTYYSSSYDDNKNAYTGSVTIPTSVTYNGKTYSVTSIGSSAFFLCSGLTSITIPNSVKRIGERAFQGCSGLTSVTIPNSVTSIGHSAFQGCSGLTSVTIPNFVTSIGSEAFYNCSGLKSVTIPNSVTSIGNRAFDGCSGLTIVKVPVTDYSAFCNNKLVGLILQSIGKPIMLIDDKGGEIKNFVIPDGVTSIGERAFNYCYRLTSVTIPNSVTSIGVSAFYGCSNLESVTIGAGVLSIGPSVFASSSSDHRPAKVIWLTNTPPEGYSYAAGTVNYVANDLYTSLSNKTVYPFLSSIFEVDGVKYVPVSPAERTCDAIDCTYDSNAENINIGKTVSYKGIEMAVKRVHKYACYNNNFIKNVELSLNGDVEDYAFYRCNNISQVTAVNGGYIGESAFQGITSEFTASINNGGSIGSKAFYHSTGLKTLEIGGNVKIVGNEAFSGCTGLLQFSTYNNGDIRTSAFKGCTSLTTAQIQNKGGIWGYAFQNCTAMTTATLGEAVTGFGGSVFSGCSSLESVVIPNSVTDLGYNAFQNCEKMISAKMGTGVRTIDRYAFSGCSSLTDVQIGINVKTIDQYAFNGCTALPKIQIPQSVTAINNNVFEKCSSLKTVIMDDGQEAELKLDYNYFSSGGNKPLFSDCPLDSVYIGRNISYSTSSSYGYSPFYRNTSLRSVHITDKETEISPNEFYGCSNLKNVRIGDGVTTIGDWAFSGCSSIDFFSFGSSVKTIGKEAFSDCTAMTKLISRATTPPSCGSQALDDINKWNCTLSVPKGYASAYQQAAQWKEFFFVVDDNGDSVDPVNPDPKKCAKPTIGYYRGKLTFNCETDGVEFHSNITDTDIRSYSSNEVQLSVTYNISVYATKSGYENSETVTATLCWIDVEPSTEGITDGTTDAKEIEATPVLIHSENGRISVSGAGDGTAIAVFGTNGVKVGAAVSHSGQAIVDTKLPSGSVAIVKIGEKSVKVVVK